MNKRMVFYIVGQILKTEALLLVLPLIVAFWYGDKTVPAFLITMAVGLALGFLMSIKKPKDTNIYAREGFVIVAICWVTMSLVGMLPFLFSGEMTSPFDAFFEMVSGFTTTGASVLTNVEAMSRSLLFWRSFSHWIGGMGVLVFVLAILPSVGDSRSIHMMRAEVPGPIFGKLVPKMRNTSIILYAIYLGMTILQIILLCAGGMPLFDSMTHAFGTAGTGGFSIKNLSVGYYNNAYFEWVIGIFMVLFGVNFNLYYLILLKRFGQAFKDEELHVYIGIIVFASVTIALNIMNLYQNFGVSIRQAFFQVSSIMTTTGFSSTDFNVWPEYSRGALVLLMFIGACASSTGGGIKVSRIILFFRMVKRGILHMLHPRAVETVHVNGRPVDERVLVNAGIFFFAYTFIASGTVLLLSLEGFSLETCFTAMAACLNNIGPGLHLVGPMGNYSEFSSLSKLLLSFNMLAGRLEIFPMLILFAPSVWRKK